jgi:uncharacterized protein YqgQ
VFTIKKPCDSFENYDEKTVCLKDFYTNDALDKNDILICDKILNEENKNYCKDLLF